MLIRRGKDEGWLCMDLDALGKWASSSGITFTNASPARLPGRGIGLIANRNLCSEMGQKPCQMLELNGDMVLSAETVKQHAAFDQDFRELLHSVGDFGRRNLLRNETPRGAILSFLLFQATVSCPHLIGRMGVRTPFTDYVKSLPCELLPTFWTPDELKLLVGTTLAPAISAKLHSLQREYDLLCSSASNTRWFRCVEPHLELDDWMQVDAMFRSRALDFHGSCMIPGMDLASHAADDRTNAFYDRSNGSYSLWLMEGKEVKEGDEITITYGDEKGACEMLFSYGFLEEEMETAETLFLGLPISTEDGFREAKMRVADCAPGFKIIDVASGDGQGQIDWSGDFVWLSCINYEDGLRFELARTVDGEEEVQASFHGQELQQGARDLRKILAESDLWPVYRLRAIVVLQERIREQLQVLWESQEDMESTDHGEGSRVRSGVYEQALKLRRLEFELLQKADEDFERQKVELAASSTVQRYLCWANGEEEGERGEHEVS